MAVNSITVVAEIFRSDATRGSTPRYERYEVQGPETMYVLDVIRWVYENAAGDLAFQYACRVGRCGTCAVKVNGIPVLACQERCKPHMRIEPIAPFPVIRDLVTDRAVHEDMYVDLGLTPSRTDEPTERPRSATPATAERVGHLNSCIACMVCVAACPAVAERPFAGPAIMHKLRHMAEHPMDERDRLQQALDGGLLECFSCDACKQLCPADLSPADAIRSFRKDLLMGKSNS